MLMPYIYWIVKMTMIPSGEIYKVLLLHHQEVSQRLAAYLVLIFSRSFPPTDFSNPSY
jgi:hypothetical protein